MFHSSAVLFLTCSALLAASNPIGLATVVGSMRLDNLEVRDNATVLEGASLETYVNPSQIALKGGTRLELGAESAGQIYLDRLVLQKGVAQLHVSSKYSILASSMRVVPDKASTVRIEYLTGESIEVSVLRGEARVLNREGILLASVSPNRAIELTREENGAGESSLTGQLVKSSGHYYLSDTATNVTYELKGENLDTAVGNCINVTGRSETTSAVQPAGESIQVTGYQVSSGCFAQSGAAPGRVPSENTRAVIAGVSGAVAILTVAPLAMVGAFSGGKATPVSPQ